MDGIFCPHCGKRMSGGANSRNTIAMCPSCCFQFFMNYPLNQKKDYIGLDGIYENKEFVVVGEPNGPEMHYGLYKKKGKKCDLVKISENQDEMVEEAKERGKVTRWKALEI